MIDLTSPATKIETDQVDFFAGDGEMASLMRSHDWSATPLGRPGHWPQPLRTMIRLLLNSRHPMYVFWGADLLCFYNDAYRQSLGPEHHPVSLGQPARAVWEEIWPILSPQIEQVMAGEGATWHENQLVPITRHGRREDVYWTYSYSPIDQEDSATGVGGVLVQCTETTAQVLAERREAARADAQAAEHERVWRNSRDLLVIVGADGIFRAVNPAWKSILGHDPDTVTGRSFLDFVWPDDTALTERGLNEAAFGADLTDFENRYRHQDGAPRWISWRTSLAGSLVYGYGRDITAQKQAQDALVVAEAALRQAQKMEALGQLTGGIAHDFNNMLQGVISGIYLAERRIAADRLQEARGFLDAAREAAGHAGVLTQRLLAFGRRQADDSKPLILDELVSAMAGLIGRTLGPAIDVRLHMMDGCWPVRCDRSQLENALLNLAINARDAMLPGGGQLVIETAHETLAGAELTGWPRAEAGDYVRISVIDTGTGMSPAVLAQAFEPFFSTKLDGQGTGLGLSQVHGFASQAKGVLRLESGLGAGTSVHLFLPRSDKLPAAARKPAAPDPPALPRAPAAMTVLLVEDEADVRRFAAKMLREVGYRVVEAADGQAGLRLLREMVSGPKEACLELLVADIGLPGGLNGRQLADAARALVPDLPILLITGYAGDAIMGKGRLGPGMEILHKPFDLETLVHRIQAMVERG